MYIVIFVTSSSKKEANKIAKVLIEERLAACVNIIEKSESVFWWKGKIDTSKEVLLIIKSRKKRLTKIIEVVKSLHSYTIPEIIAIPIISGYKPYLEWIDESVR